MNQIGPLYFNLDKNPVVDNQNNLYKYNFRYGPDKPSLLIDSNLNLNIKWSVKTNKIIEEEKVKLISTKWYMSYLLNMHFIIF